MKIKGIAAEILDSLLEMGKGSHPREFAAFLPAEDGVICGEPYIIPGTIGGSQSASVLFEMIPLNVGYIGSAHSHPSGAIRPSEADLSFFSRTGSCHIIVGHPYGQDDWGCFHADGTRIDLGVIPDE